MIGKTSILSFFIEYQHITCMYDNEISNILNGKFDLALLRRSS
jgi:hypothetical protein